jgi:hypothetical protein
MRSGSAPRWAGRLAPLLLGLVLATLFAVQLSVSSESATATPGGALHGRLQVAAASGDREAARLLGLLNDFLARRHLGVADLDQAQPRPGGRVDVGGTEVLVEGFPPFYVQVTVPGKFATQTDYDRYVETRKGALARLVETPEPIDAYLTFKDFVPVEQFLKLREAIGFEIRGLTLDVWSDGKWDSRYGHGPNTPEFWRGSSSSVLQRVAAENAGFHPGSSSKTFEYTVHIAQIVASAQSAVTLAARADVLLVDPTNDIRAALRDTAAEVFIPTMPNVFHGMWVLRSRAGTHAYPFYPDAGASQKKGP